MMDSGRRRYLKQLGIVIGSLSLAGCTQQGSGGSGNNQGTGTGGSSGGSGGSSGNWVHNVQQSAPTEKDPLVITTLGGKSGDPAVVEHAKNLTDKTGWPTKISSMQEANALQKTRTFLQSQSKDPDVFELNDEYTVALGKEGYWENVKPHLTTLDAWAPAMRDYVSWPQDGSGWEDFPYKPGVFAVPQYGNSLMLLANMDVLEKAGLSRDFTAKTFQQAYDAFQQVSDHARFSLIFPFKISTTAMLMLQSFVARTGGHFYKEGSYDMTNDGFIKALDFILTLFHEGYAPKSVTSMGEGDVANPFYSGDAAFMIAEVEQLSYSNDEIPGDKPAPGIANMQILPKPKGTGDTATGTLSPIMYSLSIFSRHKEAGAKYMNLVTTKEAQKNEYLMEGNIPIRPDVFDMPEVREQAPYPEVTQKFVEGAGFFSFPNKPEVGSIVYQNLTRSISNKVGAEKTAQRIQKEANQI